MGRSGLLVLATLLGSSGLALAEPGPQHGPGLLGMEHGHLMMLMKTAQLTDDQKLQAKQIMKDGHLQSRPLVQQIRALHAQLSDKLVGTAAVQLADLAPLRQKLRDLQVQLDDQALTSLIKIRALLRPDQLQRMSDTHAKVEALHQQMEALLGPPDEPGEGEGGPR